MSAVALLAAVATVAAVWRYTSFVPRQVSQRLTDSLLRERGYRLELDAVRGTPAGDMVFVRPRLATLGDSSRVVISAEALRVRMRRPWNVLKGNVVIERLVLERPKLDRSALPPRPAGAGEEAGGRGGHTRVAVEELQVIGGEILRRGAPVPEIDHIDLRLSLQSAGRQVRVHLQEAMANLPRDSLHIEEVSGRFVWRADTLLADEVRLRTPGSLVEARGLVAPRERYASLSGTVSPLDLQEATRVAGAPRRSGRLQGPLQVRWRDRQVVVSGTLSGGVDAYSLDQVDFEIESAPQVLVVRRATGVVNENRLDLRLESRAGRLQGHLALQDADLRRFVPERAARLPQNRLRGTADFARRTPGDTLRLDLQLESSEVRGVHIDRAEAQLAHMGTYTRVEHAEAEGPLGSVTGRGEVRGAEIDLNLDLATQDLAAMLATAGLRGPRGDVRAGGRVHGPLQSLSIETEVEFGRLEYGQAVLRRGTIGIWGELGNRPELEAQLQADTLQVQKRELQALSADLSYGGGVLHVLRSQASVGDTLLAAVGTVQSLRRDWTGRNAATTQVRLETALVQLGEQEIRVEDPAVLWLRPQALRVDSLHLVTRGGSLRLDGGLDRESRSVSLRAALEGFDLEFLRRMLHLEHELSGTASGWLEAQGSLDRTRMQGDFEAHAGTWNGMPFDTLHVALQSDAQGLEMRDLRLASPGGTLRGSLRLGYLPGVGRWLEKAHGSRSEAELRAAELRGSFTLRDLDAAAVWRARAPGTAAPLWKATISSQIQVAGSAGEPRIEVRGEATGVRRAAADIGTLRLVARYEDDRLLVQDGEVVNQGQKLQLEGQMPLHLDLTRGMRLPRDAPLAAHVTLPRSSFAIVRRFVSFFEAPPPGLTDGEIEARFDITGTLGSPQALGSLNVYGAAFSLRDMEEVYRNVDAAGEFEGKTLRITQLTARTGSDGAVRGSGRVTFSNFRSPGFDFALQVERAPILSIPAMSGLVSGRLTVSNADTLARKPVPNIHEAVLDVLEAEITQEFAAKSSEEEVFDTDKPEWLCNVTLQAPGGNVWIRNSQAEAELEGNMQLQRDSLGVLDVKGQARVRRGNYSLYFDRFEITRGELDFSRHPGFDPELDVEARRGRPGRRIYVTLTGPSTAPRLSFRADNMDLTSDEIQQELLGFDSTEKPTAAVGTYAERALKDLAGLRELQYFSIDPADPADTTLSQRSALVSYNVSAGRAISDRVFLIFTQGVKSDINQRVSLELDINRWLLLESSYERRSIPEASTDQPQNAFDVNLKYRHEY